MPITERTGWQTPGDPAARSEARRVAIRLVRRPKNETDKCRDKPPEPVPPQGCKKNQASETWSLQSTFAGSVAKVGAAATMNYVLVDTSSGGCKYLLEWPAPTPWSCSAPGHCFRSSSTTIAGSGR